MKYAALTLLGAAFIFQLWFIFWMNSRVQPQPQPEQYPWLKKEVFRPAHYAPPAAAKPSKARPAATAAPAGPVRGEMAIGGLVLEQQGEPAEDVSIL
ncbi:MAG: hypothetical protein HYZ00_07235, partial [Candidatus Hydrogenedentes bacterium]|nr:hypothetical protein [Candidatus Hydrogenedentota bacterium]